MSTVVSLSIGSLVSDALFAGAVGAGALLSGRSRTNKVSEQNNNRIARQMSELQTQMDKSIRQAQNEAHEASIRRIAEAERRSNQRLQDLANSTNSRMSQMQEETQHQLRNIREQQAKTINNLERQVHGDMNNMRNQLNSRINSLGENLVEVQKDLLGRISDTNARIDATNRHVDLVQKGLNNLTGYVGEMENRIDETFRMQQNEINTVQNEVKSIQDQLAVTDSRGIERAKLALAMMEEVEVNNDLNRFVPAEAEKVRRRLEALASSGAYGPELSAAANEAMLSINELEIECSRERLKYEQKEEMTLTMLETILRTVNQLREIELSDDEGNPVSLENNFWSRGKYNELKEHLESLQEEMKRRSHTDMTIERLDEIQSEIVNAEVKLQDITSQSVVRVNLSQARMQAVSDIIDVMEEQHWEVVQSNGEEEIGYAGGEMDSDYREGAFARLRNDMGEEVTIIVDPDENESKNTLGFHFSGGKIATDEENERKAAAVAEEISRSGYQVGVPKCAGHQPMPEMDTASSMTQQGASRRMRERMRQ